MATDSEVVADAMTALGLKGRQAVIDGAQLLIENADRFAIGRARTGWFDAIRDGLNKAGIERWLVKIPNSEACSHLEGSSDYVLEGQDESKRNEADFLASISSVEDLLGILAEQRVGEDSASFSGNFDWRKAIRKVAKKLTASRTRELADALSGTDREAFYLLDLARHAGSIGESRLTQELAIRAVERSSHFGWDRSYDGGSRLESLEYLIEIDPSTGRAEAWRRFREDFNDENYYRTRFTLNLKSIANLLAEAVPVRELYFEIEQYVQALFHGVELNRNAPDLRLGQGGPNEGALEAINLLVEFHLMHPAPWSLESVWRLLGHLIRTQPSGGKAIIERLLAASEEVQERLLPVLEAIGRSDRSLIAPYQDGIMALAGSRHGGLRCTVRRIANALGWRLRERQPPAVPRLPAIYSLTLPPIDQERLEEVLAEDWDERLVSRGLDELPLAAHIFELERMARVTGIPTANLITRADQIMSELDPSRGWTDEAEKRLQVWLDNIGPKFVYRRPRYVIGRRAVHHLLAELEDYGLADPYQVSQLCDILRWYDPSLVLHHPASRPAAIPAMMKDRHTYGERWLGEIEHVFCQIMERTSDRRIILAEETHLAHPVWENYREERLTQIVTGIPDTPGEGEEFFARVKDCPVERYPLFRQRGFSPPLVLRNVPFHLEGSGGKWLALNPWVGEELGWKATDEGWFRWIDADGQVMAESIHWVDGPIDLSPFADSEVGEGYIVIINPDAANQIFERFGAVTRVVRVTRNYREGRSDRASSSFRVGTPMEL